MNRPTALLQDASNAQTLAFNAQRNPLVLEGLGNQNAQSAQSLAHNAQLNPLLLQNQGTKNQQAVLDLGQEQSNVANQKVALSLLDSIRKNAGGPDDVRRMLSNQSPEVSTLVLQGLGNSFGTLYGSTATVDPNQVTSLPAEQLQIAASGRLPKTTESLARAGTQYGRQEDVVLGYGKYGLPSKPVSQSTLGELGEFGRNVLIPNTRNNEQLGLKDTGKGSSAVGAYQFTQETVERLAPKVFGSEWKNTIFTKENQDKLAEVLFNESKNGNLKAIWQGLPNATPGAYKDVPWSQMKEIIGNVESKVITPRGSSTPALNQTITSTRASGLLSQAQQDVAFKTQANDPTGVARAVMKNIGSEASTQEVANKLTGKGGLFEGANITNQLNNIIRQTGAPAAVAGDILARNVKQETWDDVVKRYLLPVFTETSEIGNDTLIRDAGVERDIKAFNSPVVKDIVRRNEAINKLNADATAAITALKQSEELLRRAQGLGSTIPGQASQIPNLQAQVSKQQSRVSQLLNKLSDLDQVK